MKRWRLETNTWHACHLTKELFEATNCLTNQARRVAFGRRRFRNYRIGALLYISQPNWDLLATITLRCNPVCLLNMVPNMGDAVIR